MLSLLKAGEIREEVNMIKEGEDHLVETDRANCESFLENWKKTKVFQV